MPTHLVRIAIKGVEYQGRINIVAKTRGVNATVRANGNTDECINIVTNARNVAVIEWISATATSKQRLTCMTPALPQRGALDILVPFAIACARHVLGATTIVLMDAAELPADDVGISFYLTPYRLLTGKPPIYYKYGFRTEGVNDITPQLGALSKLTYADFVEGIAPQKDAAHDLFLRLQPDLNAATPISLLVERLALFVEGRIDSPLSSRERTKQGATALRVLTRMFLRDIHVGAAIPWTLQLEEWETYAAAQGVVFLESSVVEAVGGKRSSRHRHKRSGSHRQRLRRTQRHRRLLKKQRLLREHRWP